MHISDKSPDNVDMLLLKSTAKPFMTRHERLNILNIVSTITPYVSALVPCFVCSVKVVGVYTVSPYPSLLSRYISHLSLTFLLSPRLFVKKRVGLRCRPSSVINDFEVSELVLFF